MDEQQEKKPKYSLPTLKEYKQKQATTKKAPIKDLIGAGAPQSEESKAAMEEWNSLGPFAKLGRKANVGWKDMVGGVQASIGEILPILGTASNSPLTPADAMVASMHIKKKAIETLEKAHGINAPTGDWTDIAMMAPLLVGIGASAAASPFTAGTSLSAIPGIISGGTMGAMTASVYGNSILEQEEYEKATGKEIGEFPKQSVAILSAASMLLAGELVGSGSKLISKTFGDAIASAFKESPQLATNMMRRYISEVPGAAQKVMKLGKNMAGEAVKSGTTFGVMVVAQDLLANINKYPEDRLAFQEIVADGLNAFKGGLLFGVLLGGIHTGQSSMYNYLRRKKQGINVVQTTDGQVYERIGNSVSDPSKVTVLDKNLNFKDIARETIEDSFSMTVAEKNRYLDAYKTHKEAMPGIEEAIKLNAVKRQTKALTEQLIFKKPTAKGNKPGTGTQSQLQAEVILYDVMNPQTKLVEKWFVESVSIDGKLASILKVVPKGDGTYGIIRAMDKNFDMRKTTSVNASDFAQMAFEFYTTAEAAKPKADVNPKTGEPVDPLVRQKNEDAAHKATKVGDEIEYMGRRWEVQEIDLKGNVKAQELKDTGEYGEELIIPPETIDQINAKFEEPAVEEVTVDGVKMTAHAGPPVYERDGKPVSKAYVKGAIRMAKTPMDLSGLRWENDPELSDMYKAKFPDMVQTYKIEGEEVDKDEVVGAISHASDPTDLLNIEINLDPEVKALLDTKLAALYEPMGKAAGAEYFGIQKIDENVLINFNVPVEGQENPASISMKPGFTPEELVKKVEEKKVAFKSKEVPVEKKPIAPTFEIKTPATEKPADKKVRTPEQVIVESMTEQEYVEGELSKLVGGVPEETRKARIKEYKAKYRQMKASLEKPTAEKPVEVIKEDGTINAKGIVEGLKPIETKPVTPGPVVQKLIDKIGEISRSESGYPQQMRDDAFETFSGIQRAATTTIAQDILDQFRAKYPNYETSTAKDYQPVEKKPVEVKSIETKPAETNDQQLLRIATEDSLDKLMHGKLTENQIQKHVEILKKNFDLLPNISKSVARKWLDEHGFGYKPEATKDEVEPSPIAATTPEQASEMLKTIPVYHGTFGDFSEFDPAKLGEASGARSAKEGFFFATNPTVAASYASKTRKRIDEINPRLTEIENKLKELTGGDGWIQAGHKLVQLEVNNTPAYSEEVNEKVRDLLEARTQLEDELQSFEETWMNDQVELADEGSLKKVYLDVKNPLLRNFKSSDFRDEPYSKIIKDAKAKGHDAVIFQNTYDGGDPAGQLYLTDVIAVFDKSQIHNEPITNEQRETEKPTEQSDLKKGTQPKDIIPRSTASDKERAIAKGKGEFKGIHKIVNERFRASLERDYERYKAEYLGKYGNVISGDLAKSLSPDYRANMTEFSQAVHDPSSDFAKKLFDDLVRGEAASEMSNYVLMTAGGTGAGKTTALNFKLAKDQPPVLIYDSNMANYDTSVGRIEKALEHGKEVDILFVWRDPVDAYMDGVIPRMKEERRSIGIAVHVNTTAKALANIKKLYDLYRDNDNVDFEFYDNSLKAFVNPEDIFSKTINEDELNRRLQDEVQSLFNEGGLTKEEKNALTQTSPGGDGSEVQGTGRTEEKQEVAFKPEPVLNTPEFAGQSVKYTPFDNWDSNLMASRDYARHLFSKEELDAFTANGSLKWNDTASIVGIIKGKLAQLEPKTVVDTERRPTTETKLSRDYFETDVWNQIKDSPEIQAEFEANMNDPQNQRIAVEHKVRKIITDYYVGNLENLLAKYNKPEIYEGLFQKLTDRLYADRPNLKKAEFAGERISTGNPDLKLQQTHSVPAGKYHETPSVLVAAEIKKDVVKFSKELVKQLGGEWEHSKDRKGKIQYASVNLPPAGGDARIELSKTGTGLGVEISIPYEPIEMTSGGGYGDSYQIRGTLQNQGYGPIMWRLTIKDDKGKVRSMNNQWIAEVSAGQLAQEIKNLMNSYLKSTEKANFDNFNDKKIHESSQTITDDTAVSDTPRLDTPEVVGGVESAEVGGPLPSGEATGLPEFAGDKVGGTDRPTYKGGTARGSGPGSSDIRDTGPDQGRGTSSMVERTQRQDTGDRTQPENIADRNHVIQPDDVIIPKGEAAKIRANIAAIELLRKLEADNRNPTPEEKQVLVKFTGWGGLAPVFDKAKWERPQYYEEWHKKYGSAHKKLLSLMSEEEFQAAINSTINAHYTAIPITRELWSLAEHLGFKGGNVLEPGLGIGHFYGTMPEYLKRTSSLKGYELDSVTGRIAAKLYPQVRVNVKGYELANEPIASQDLIITNVPFGKTAPFDAKNQDLSKFSLHNYFIAKGIRQLKPGGIGIFITSSSTMDNAASIAFRNWVVTEGDADFIGAVRLPNNAFAENAGTEVTTDVLIFRKRLNDRISHNAEGFRNIVVIGQVEMQYGGMTNLEVNEYYSRKPENMLGTMTLAHEAGSGGLYSGDSQTLVPNKGQDTVKELANRLSKMPKGIMETTESKPPAEVIAASEEDRNGTIMVKENKVYEVKDGDLILTDWNDKTVKIKGKSYKTNKVASDYLQIKELTNELITGEQNPAVTDESLNALRTKLNTAYDTFFKNYGQINYNKSLEFLEDDSEHNAVAALEDIESSTKLDKAGRSIKTRTITKSPIFSERVNFPVVEPTKADNVEDALYVSMSYRNSVDIPYIASMLGKTEEQATSELLEEGLVFRNPATEQIEDKDTYLSGYVRTKYKTALEASKDNPLYLKNVEALKAVVPKDIPGQLIKFSLGTPWMPAQIVQDFIRANLDVDAAVVYNNATGHWIVKAKNGQYGAKNKTAGTEEFSGFELIDKALNLRTPRVVRTEYNWDGGRRVKTEKVDLEATAQAQGKMDEIMDAFVNYVYDNSQYVEQIETVYNDKYKDYIEKSHNAPTFEYFPGANKVIKLMGHQKVGAIRGLKESTLFAMQVGIGKTFTMATLAMELRRLKLAKKPMIVVQNSTLEQFGNEFRKLYPAAKILVPTKNQMDAKKRQMLFNKIAYGDWDAIIIPQSFLDFIPDDPARERAYIQERIAELQEVLEEVDDGSYNNPVASDIKKSIEALMDQMDKIDNPKQKTKKVKDIAKSNLAKEKGLQQQASRRKDDVRLFENMGVDALFVDEAHAYKKLGFATALSNIKGIDTKGSKRAFGLFMKVRYIQEKMKGRNVFLSTGTPITNTMAEVWTMMKYVSPDILKKHNIDTFDKFASTFGSIEPSLEFTAAGKFKIVKRFKAYKNAPELMNLFRANSYVVLTEDIPEFKESNTIPKLKNSEHTKVILPQTTELKAKMEEFKSILERWEKLPGKEKRANRHIPLVVFTRAKQAAIDLRLLNPANYDDPGSKTNAVVKEVKRLYDETNTYKGTQLIFSDTYQSPDMGPGTQRFDIYEDIKKKLVAQGVPENEIVILREQAGALREGIFERVNKGDIRILMGSTQKLGTGVNVQTLLKAIHHIDAPDRPDKFEQRNGRLLRQGNEHASMGVPVEVATYGVEKTLDATAYQRLAIKQKFINQMMKGEALDRETSDAAADEEATDMTFDQMMANLSGSQSAILHTQKMFELKKLQTAKRNYERGMIDAKKGLQNAKTISGYLTDALTDVKNATELIRKHFKSLEVVKPLKPTAGNMTEAELAKALEDEKKFMSGKYPSGLNVESITFNGRKYAGEKMLEGFNLELTKAIDIAKTGLAEGKTNILKINDIPIGVFVSYDGRNDRFIYQIEPIQGSSAEAKVTGYFTSGAGFFQSLKIQYNNFLEGKVADVERRLAQHKADIPNYEKALTKTFDKQDILDKTEMQVRDLEQKMKEETESDLSAPKPLHPAIWAKIDQLALDRTIPDALRTAANEASQFKREGPYKQKEVYDNLIKSFPELQQRFDDAIKEEAAARLRIKKIEWLQGQAKDQNNSPRTREVLDDYLERMNQAEGPAEIDALLNELANKGSMIRNKFNEIELAAQKSGEFGDLDVDIEDSGEPEPVFMRRPKATSENDLRNQITVLEDKIDALYRQKEVRIKAAKGIVSEGMFAGERIQKREIKANVDRIIEDYDSQIAGIEAELVGLRKQLDTAVIENEGQRSIWDNPDYPRYKIKPTEFAGSQVDAMKEHELIRRANIMTDYTGVPIKVVRTKNDLPAKIVAIAKRQFGDLSKSSIPALYDRSTKTVWVVIEDTRSVSEMVSNLSHEIFAHHGLVALLGKEPYLKVLQLVYRGMSPVDIANKAEEYNVPESDWKTIADEYIGDMAGNGQINPTLWQKIVAAIREWIRKIYNIAMSKAEIINLLNKSKQNLVKNKPEPKDYTNIGEYLQALEAFTSKPGKVVSEHGYGVRISESRAIEESVAKGNLDYATYFGVADSQVGSRVSDWIERALINNNFDYEQAIDYLDTKMVQYARFERHLNMVKTARSYLADNPPKNQDTLYKVLVGKGRTPEQLNFLTWEQPAEFDQQESIMNQLDIEGNYGIHLLKIFQSGESIYKALVNEFGSDREASLFLSRAGIDGMKYNIAIGVKPENGYVIYDNTPVDILNQIAFKRSQKPMFVGEHLANAGKVYADQAKTKRNWEETIRGIREYFQDKDLPVRRFEEEIIKRGGLQPNDAKPYRDIFNAYGRQEALYKDYVKTKMEPITGTIAKIIRTGMPGENVLPYMIAKHAIERNMVMRAEELDAFINKPSAEDPTPEEIQDFKDAIADKDYSGVMEFDVKKEFVNPDELAQTIVDEFEAAVPRTLVNELWNNVRPAASAILDYWEAGQQLSPEQKQDYLDRFQYFIPLRGWRDGAAKDLVYVKGDGFKKSLMHAEGRKSLADNPLSHMLNVAFTAIGEQVDNEVKSSMLRLLMRNLSGADLYDLATVKKLYYVRVDLPDGTYEWEPTLDRPPQEMFEDGRAKTKIYNEYQKLRSPKQAREHEVVVKRQGGDVVMIFKGNQLPVAQALNKRNYMYHNLLGKVKDARINNRAVEGLSAVNNFLKATYTSWNVVFPFTNFMRDFQEASITQMIRENAGHKVVANYTRAFPAIMRHLRDKLDMNNPDDVKLRDFYMTGGATGFTHLKTAEQLEKDLMKEINLMVGRGTVRGDIKHYASEAVNIVAMWNQMFEDATRFSVYLTSLDLGKSKEEAASDAKEASVNFNRGGKSKKLYDAIYAFWNVAIQSLQKNFKLAKDYPGKFATIAGTFMALGFIEAMINKMTDDEDPESNYYNINSWMRENYLILPNIPRLIAGESKGNKYLSIPLPQFWRGFKSVGSLAYDFMQGQVTAKEAISKAMLNFGGAMSPIDIGGFGKTGEFSLAPIVPTVFKPFYDVATNRNYMGYTIAREPFDKAQKKLLANAGLGKDNVNPAAKFFTDMLFRWGGGDNATKYYMSKTGEEKKVPGILDINPSFVEHVFKGYTGGTGAVFSDLITTISQAFGPEEEVNFKNIPFVNRFIRQTPEAKWNIIAEYYNLKDAVAAHKGLKRDYLKQAEAGGDIAGIELTEGSTYYQTYQEILDDYDRSIKEISDQVDFDDVEGTKPMYDLMQQAINDIKALKKQHNMK